MHNKCKIIVLSRPIMFKGLHVKTQRPARMQCPTPRSVSFAVITPSRRSVQKVCRRAMVLFRRPAFPFRWRLASGHVLPAACRREPLVDPAAARGLTSTPTGGCGQPGRKMRYSNPHTHYSFSQRRPASPHARSNLQ